MHVTGRVIMMSAPGIIALLQEISSLYRQRIRFNHRSCPHARIFRSPPLENDNP
jgi:hypothetical protein